MKNLFIAVLICFSASLHSQDFPGFSSSNYAGISGLDLQPASIVDSRYKFDATLIGVSVNAYNNYIGLKKSALSRNGSLVTGTYPAFEDTAFQKNYLFERQDDRRKSIYLSNQVILPSFMVTINEKSALAFNWRVRNYVNIDGVERQLAKLLYEDIDYNQFWNIQFSNKRLSVQTMSWAEYGLSYGRIILDEKKHFLKAAGRVKLLQGLQAAYMFVNDLKYKFTTDSTVDLFQSEVQYGHSTNFEFGSDNSIKYKWVSNPSVGFDLGFVYEWRPDIDNYTYEMDGSTDLQRRDKNKYKLRAGLSILDIGGIKFEKGDRSRDFIANVNFWDFRDIKLEDTPIQALDDTLLNRFEQKSDKRSFYMNLPTAVSTQLDYQIWKDFYLNFTTYWAMQFKKNPHKVHDITTFSLAPRWDHKWFGVFVPVSYNMMGNFAIGTSVRLGPLVLGTSNLAPFAGNANIYGTDFFMALKVPVPYGKPKDRDKDKVSDKKDKCKNVPGLWAFMGCPDSDGDFIQDSEDACPQEPGVKEFNGCPDRDNDKIQDKDDLCPNEPGLAEFNGCPDLDGDKIIDKEDDCPELAGVAEFNGCPDTDGDHVQDKVDLCPDDAGPMENEGCPDKDNDGVFDNIDLCPEEAGLKENHGCPYPDRDNDKVYDKDDGCPDVAGPLENKGCPWPDSDKDGVLDKDDKCAFTAGPPSNNGCPVIEKDEQDILNTAFSNLEFASGKDIIKKESFPSLDALADLLKKKKEWNLKLSGHTDNVGGAQKNLILSKKRSESVKKYLVKKGVSDKRITAEWFGQTKPVDDNNTESGRQRNRRVEMKIEFK